MTEATLGAVPAAEPELKHGALTLFDTTIIAVSSVAPAYSVATALAGLAAVVALQMPAAVLVGFFPVAGIAVAFYFLNRSDPNCGASYTWVSKALSPGVGFINGWVIFVADIIFCAFAAPQGGQATLQLLNNAGINSLGPFDLSAQNFDAATIVGFLWLLLVTWAVIRGIQIAARFQWVLCGLEYGIVVLLAVAGILHGGGSSFSLSWLSPFQFTPQALAGGVVITVFLYWGWDTAANVNEESQDATENPGKAGILGMLALLIIFLISTISVQMVLTPDELQKSGTSTLNAWATKVFPEPWASLGVIALISSTVATVQTTLLPGVRTALAMGRDGVFGKVWARIHPVYRTPALGTVIIAAMITAIMVVDTRLGAINAIVGAGVTSIGLLVAFYYGMAGIACAVYYRRQLSSGAGPMIWMGIVPAASALVLFGLAAYLTWSLWTGTDSLTMDASNGRFQVVVSAAVLITGVVAMLIARMRASSDFFHMKRESAPAVEPATA